MITTSSLTKTYGKRESTFKALTNVSLELPEGGSIAIIGKSGSGKSTLMHVLSGLDRATSGTVQIGEHAVSSMKKVQRDRFRSETIGFIFQSFFVSANESCQQNVELALEIARVPRKERSARALAALEAVGLGDKAKQRASTLSGGQKQRLAIARAIVNNPRYLFCDEPTGNLDSATGEQVVQLLFKLNKDLGTTLIIVTHDEDLAALCETRLAMKDGMVVSQASAKPKKK